MVASWNGPNVGGFRDFRKFGITLKHWVVSIFGVVISNCCSNPWSKENSESLLVASAKVLIHVNKSTLICHPMII